MTISTHKTPRWLTFALDFGPLLAFFLANRFGASKADLAQGPIIGTGVFMVAISIAVIVSKWKIGRVAPMLWLSAALVLFFGGLTIWFHDPKFIQTKPTYIYAFFAALLIGGWVRRKPMLKYVLGAAFEGLNEAGWLKVSRNWGVFFLAMAGVNEILRMSFSFETWLTLKVWGVMALTFLFGMANIPMLMRHGLKLDDGSDSTT
jgi:intracellular septation protein